MTPARGSAYPYLEEFEMNYKSLVIVASAFVFGSGITVASQEENLQARCQDMAVEDGIKAEEKEDYIKDCLVMLKEMEPAPAASEEAPQASEEQKLPEKE